MTRPDSIIRFEQLYLLSFAIGLLATALGWRMMQYMVDMSPPLAALPALLPAVTVVRAVLILLLWWLVARRGSIIAKWIVVVVAAFVALNLLGALYGIALGRLGPLTGVTTAVAGALFLWATAMLFRPDAAAWFDRRAEPSA